MLRLQRLMACASSNCALISSTCLRLRDCSRGSVCASRAPRRFYCRTSLAACKTGHFGLGVFGREAVAVALRRRDGFVRLKLDKSSSSLERLTQISISSLLTLNDTLRLFRRLIISLQRLLYMFTVLSISFMVSKTRSLGMKSAIRL